MIIIPYKMSKLNILNKADEVIKYVRFIEYEEINLVLKACNYDTDNLRYWFDIIGIKYDDIEIVHKVIIYTINGETLSLSELSHGERTLIYILACKNLNKSVVVHGLLERLCGKFKKILYDNFKDYEKLVIVKYNAYLPEYLDEYVCQSEDRLVEVLG